MTLQKNVQVKARAVKREETFLSEISVSQREWDALQAIAAKYNERNLDKVINTILHKAIYPEVEAVFEGDSLGARPILRALEKEYGW